MFSLSLTLFAAVSLNAAPPTSHETPTVFEMRTYYSPPGKLDALHARFRDHTMKLFAKHGITNVGYFVPVNNEENKLIYFLSYPSLEARNQSWENFQADPDWKKAKADSEKDGKLVAKVVSRFLTPTDYSPKLTPAQAKKPRVLELRTYTTTPGNLDNLHARFRDHTMKLFEKHGMTNLVYWVPVKGQKGDTETLVYLLAHDSQQARDASFGAFRQDPEWVKVLQASEAKAGGSLTAPGGVKSEMLHATDYSPLR
ncbi:MAG: NIPSNAP family protein [Bacteroidales bacterium]|nr:NIPSNAP family protein [Bacteroidales bacterium]